MNVSVVADFGNRMQFSSLKSNFIVWKQRDVAVNILSGCEWSESSRAFVRVCVFKRIKCEINKYLLTVN